MIRSEWKGREAFAEFAEAVGVPTDQVAVAGEIDGLTIVIYSPDRDLTRRGAIQATFRRDGDGLLVKVNERPVPDFFDGIEDALQ